MFTSGFFNALLTYTLPLVADTGGAGMSAEVEKAKTGISILFLGLIIPVIIVLIVVIWIVYRNTIGKKRKTTLLEDYIKEAEGLENSGKYVSAAHVYESKLGNLKRAAELYEKGSDYRKAASLYDLLDENAKAKEMYEKDGNIDDSAEVSIREGEYEDAARLYDKAGKKHDAALLMERACMIHTHR